MIGFVRPGKVKKWTVPTAWAKAVWTEAMQDWWCHAAKSNLVRMAYALMVYALEHSSVGERCWVGSGWRRLARDTMYMLVVGLQVVRITMWPP